MINSMIMFLEASAALNLVSIDGKVARPLGTDQKVNDRRYICSQINA